MSYDENPDWCEYECEVCGDIIDKSEFVDCGGKCYDCLEESQE